MATTVFDPSEGPSAEQQAAETAALEQGEKIAQMQQEDRARKYDQAEAANEEASLIAGKFKSQDDLVKAYEELQKKLGNTEPEEGEEPAEEQPEATEEQVEETTEETPVVFDTAAQQFAENGELSSEMIEQLSSMDSKDLVAQYMDFYRTSAQPVQQKQLEAHAEAKIRAPVEGGAYYPRRVQWAGQTRAAPQQATVD